MRSIITGCLLAATVGFVAMPAAHAQQAARYCRVTADSGDLDCSFNTIQECKASGSGSSTTGICERNPAYQGVAQRRR